MKLYRALAVLSLLLGLLSLLLVFMILPSAIIAPVGLMVGLVSRAKSNDKKLANAGIILNLIAILLLAGLRWFWSGLQIEF